jgi:hypothetical protein
MGHPKEVGDASNYYFLQFMTNVATAKADVFQ